jgi:hypothetical protein
MHKFVDSGHAALHKLRISCLWAYSTGLSFTKVLTQRLHLAIARVALAIHDAMHVFVVNAGFVRDRLQLSFGSL